MKASHINGLELKILVNKSLIGPIKACVERMRVVALLMNGHQATVEVNQQEVERTPMQVSQRPIIAEMIEVHRSLR